MIPTTYTTTPTVRYEFDAEDDAWYGYLVWSGPHGEARRAPLSLIEHADDKGTTE